MDFSKLDGLIPAVVQDHVSGEVLMVGFMNAGSLGHHAPTGYVTFYSRTRNTLWTKGETSGNRLAVRDILSTATTTRCSSRPNGRATATCVTRASAPVSFNARRA